MARRRDPCQSQLGPGQTVYTRDGRELGRIEAFGCEAFKVAPMTGERSYWLQRDALGEGTDGGSVVLCVTFDELDAWRWTPPQNAFRSAQLVA